MAKRPTPAEGRGAQERSASWRIHFLQRHRDDDPSQAVPARAFLERCPVAARMAAVLKAVAEAPPNAFAGGGYWEACTVRWPGTTRSDGRDRRHYRLFCVLERDGARLGLGGPNLVVLTGMERPFRTAFTERDYAHVRKLGDEYRSHVPRSVSR